jgi:hypothetical protein
MLTKVPGAPDFGEKELMTGACALASVEYNKVRIKTRLKIL